MYTHPHTHTHEHMHNLFLISGLASLMTFMMIELLYGPAHHSFPTGSAQNRLSWWVCSFNSTFTFENIVWFALMFNSDINTFLIYRYKTRLYSLSLRLQGTLGYCNGSYYCCFVIQPNEDNNKDMCLLFILIMALFWLYSLTG